MTPLEERIGYKFRNSLLLAEALTHPSLGHETQRYHFDNQRLEFLGDAVLQLERGACGLRFLGLRGTGPDEGEHAERQQRCEQCDERASHGLVLPKRLRPDPERGG